jgi:hypothetical protein
VGRALGSHSSQPALPIGVFEGFESIYSSVCAFAVSRTLRFGDLPVA